MTFILIHGSWHNSQVWSKVEHQLTVAGHTVYAPTLIGFESITTPSIPENGLHTHIDQIIRLIESQSITDAILVGHSYSGLVISGVAARLPKQVRKLIYLDAFIPDDGQSLFDILGSETETHMRHSLVDGNSKSLMDGATTVWLLPPGKPQDYGVTDPDDQVWLQERLVYTPVSTFEEKVHLPNGYSASIDHCFIRCTEFSFLAAQEYKANAMGWRVFHIDSGHDAMITVPIVLSNLLLQIVEDHD